MTDLYEVEFSAEEPPMWVAGESAEAALGQALERMHTLDLPLSLQPATKLAGSFPDWQDFTAFYSLVENPYDRMAGMDARLYAATGIEWEAVRATPLERVWTLIEDSDVWWITPGLHFVNRLGYLIAQEARVHDERTYLYE